MTELWDETDLWDDLAPVEGVSWPESALCAQTDPEAFYPEKGQPAEPAKAVCLRCPVRLQCLDYALAHDERFGVWGGLSERERRAYRRRKAGEVATDATDEG